MRLRHIEVFHAIMQVGTISGAAQVLHISQPAVTKVLQHCELQLGMPLFERVRGKLYPEARGAPPVCRDGKTQPRPYRHPPPGRQPERPCGGNHPPGLHADARHQRLAVRHDGLAP